MAGVHSTVWILAIKAQFTMRALSNIWSLRVAVSCVKAFRPRKYSPGPVRMPRPDLVADGIMFESEESV